MENPKNITETILDRAGRSPTEVARRLTVHGSEYYTVNQVAHWLRTGKIPAEHARVVAQVFNLSIEEVAPYLFEAYHRNHNK